MAQSICIFVGMILLTGASGLLGSHLAVNLLLQGHAVRAVARPGSDRDAVRRCFAYYQEEAEPYISSLSWVEAELDDIAELETAFAGVHQVYHCAAQVSFHPSDAREMLYLNPLITANITHLCLAYAVEKMVYVSSVAALGRKGKGVISEQTQWEESRRNSVYARSKHRAELEVWRAIQEGLNAVIVNPSIILGPGKWQSGSNALFAKVAGGFNYYTNGVNAYVDVRDVATAMIRLMESEISGERFILAAENRSYREVFEMIAQALAVKAPQREAGKFLSEVVWRLEKFRSMLSGKGPVITRETARTAQSVHHYSNEKITNFLDFSFRPLQETIGEMAVWYRKENHEKPAV